jgi:hypothetical protein
MTSFLGYCNFLFLNGELDGMQLCLLYSIDDGEGVGWGGVRVGVGVPLVSVVLQKYKCLIDF